VTAGAVNSAQLMAIRDKVIADFKQAVECARQQPLPTTDDLLSDVFA
jgi:TPP-dependent pyruvate/acetoin dehydrogenase alpha subunit